MDADRCGSFYFAAKSDRTISPVTLCFRTPGTASISALALFQDRVSKPQMDRAGIEPATPGFSALVFFPKFFADRATALSVNRFRRMSNPAGAPKLARPSFFRLTTARLSLIWPSSVIDSRRSVA